MTDRAAGRMGLGLVAMVASCFAFGTSGPFAKALIAASWSPSMVVFLRMAGAALVLLPYTLWSLRGRWSVLARESRFVVAYGSLAVAAAQLGYFQAVSQLTVGVALLLEYLGIVLVVIWVWYATGRAPHALTWLGIVVAISGLVVVLDVAGAVRPAPIGVAWGMLAAVGLAGHYVLAARETAIQAPVFAGLGLIVGALALAVLGLVRVLPMRPGASSVTIAGHVLPTWLAFVELVLAATVAAYVLGIVGARLVGSTVASFLGLTEVLFAILVAWVVLGEWPRPTQAAGGALILLGVAAVRAGDLRAARAAGTGGGSEPDFPVPTIVS